MNGYHLTFRERKLVAQWQDEQVSGAEIARRLERHCSTIFRELKRNGVADGYVAADAHARADARRRKPRRSYKMDVEEISDYVRSGLVKRWSPDQIAGRARREFPRSLSEDGMAGWKPTPRRGTRSVPATLVRPPQFR